MSSLYRTESKIVVQGVEAVVIVNPDLRRDITPAEHVTSYNSSQGPETGDLSNGQRGGGVWVDTVDFNKGL